MFNWILKTIIGSKNQRELRRLQPIVRQINEIEQGLSSVSDDELRAKTLAWKEELSAIQDNEQLAARLEEILPEVFAVVKKRRPPPHRAPPFLHGLRPAGHLGDGSFRRPAHRRNGPASGPDCGNGDRRRQDPRRHAPCFPERAHRARCPCRDGQRLPRPPRRRVDGAALRVPRSHHRNHPARPAAGCPPRAIRHRHHLRGRTASSASTTCATTAWRPAATTRFSGDTILRLSTRWIRSSSTRPARRSSSAARPRFRPISTTASSRSSINSSAARRCFAAASPRR